MKKMLCILLCLLLLIATAGCAGSGTAPASPASSAAPAAPSSAPSPSAAPPESAAPATDYPTGPILITVTASAGGSFDTATRLVAPFVEKQLGTTIQITNNDNGGGWVGWMECQNAKPDGYALTTVNFPQFFSCYNPEMQRTQRIEDYHLVANFVSDPNVLCVSKDSSIQTLQEFVDYCANNKDIVIGTTALAGDDHLCYLKLLDCFPVMQETTTPLIVNSITDTIANQLGGFSDFMVCNVGDLKSLLQDDKIRVLCVFAEDRVDLVPDIPTFAELAAEMNIDYKIVNGSSRGIMMPKGGDPAVVEKIVGAFRAGLDDPELRKAYEDMFYVWNGVTGEDYARLVKEEEESFKKVMYLLGWE